MALQPTMLTRERHHLVDRLLPAMPDSLFLHGCSLQAQFGQVLVQLTREASMTAVGYFNAVQAAGQAASPTASPAVVVPVKQVGVCSCALHSFAKSIAPWSGVWPLCLRLAGGLESMSA